MASLGQSTRSTRNRDGDLPDPCDEKRELRRMVQELEAENERLRKALQDIRSQANDMDADGLETREIWITAHSAVNGGGRTS